VKKLSLLSVIFLFSLLTLISCNKGQKDMKYAIDSIQNLRDLFPKTVGEIEQKVKQSKELISKIVNKIISIENSQRSYQNTVKALDNISEKLSYLTNPFEVLEFVNPQKEIRDSAHNAMIELQAFTVKEISTNKELYKAIKYYYDNQFKKERENLSKEEIYFLEETIKSFERSGLNLPDDKLEQVRTLLKEINKLQLDFEQNINNDESKIEVTLEELKGTPQQIINSLEKSTDGKYIVRTDYPTVFGIMQHGENQETRKRVQQIFSNRAYPQNYSILREMLIKKNELAKLLGYRDFAHFDLEENMAKSPENVKNFINNISNKAKIKAKKEIELFTKDLKDKTLFDESGKIKPWNTGYILNEYKKNYLQLDEKEVSKYFPLENTIKELLDIYQQFLNLQLKEVNTTGFWHSDVKLIETYKNNHLIGYLLLDLHPRPNKYTHACSIGIIPAIKKGEKICPAVNVVIANFTKSTNEDPALLTLSEVTTFFHEFGHAMHSLLGRTKIASFSGTSVKSDFVELPSQMLENWLNDKNILKKISKHYQTGEALTDKLIEKIVELKKLNSGDYVLRQLSFATVSLNLFNEDPNIDFDELSKKIHNELRNYIMWDPESHLIASFGHLANGSYGPKYYGYMWSNVFAHDLFNTIKQKGLLNNKIGQDYIDKVIGKGGSQDPNELIEDFLGRKPNEKAFIEDMGFEF
jgi:thimet oligopeptidase